MGNRQALVDRTRASILHAAHEEVVAGEGLSVGRVARRAGVSRITVYNRFGSRSGLLRALTEQMPAPPQQMEPDADARSQLQRLITTACSTWASHALLLRHLPRHDEESGLHRQLAERLASTDELRPGCSIKEAEDVIAALTSFDMFERLYRDGRRTPAAVAEILARLASAILV
jgi:AcrR family transcriptional regulator